MSAPPHLRPARRVVLDAEVVRAHQTSVWRYLRFLGCPATSADDLTQETFLVLMRSEVEDRGSAALDAWLRRVAWNLSREHFRERRRAIATLVPEQLEQAWVEYAGADGGDRYHDALRACLGTIDERARLAIELRYREGATRVQIAEVLAVGEEGAKTLLRRAKERLRRCIERRLSDDD